jgi:hypothetical protein
MKCTTTEKESHKYEIKNIKAEMKKSECEMRSSKVNMYRVDKKMIKKNMY